MPALLVLLAGLALGVLSRVEETADGFSLGISSDGTWLLAAAVAAALGGTSLRGAVVAGAAILTAANLGYYAWVLAAEPGVPLASVAGPPARWFVLGAAGGAVFGAAGRVWAAGGPAPRVGAALLVAGVLVADGITAVRGGPAGAGVGLAAGIALPLLSARTPRWRVVAAACVALVVAVASTGHLERLLP